MDSNLESILDQLDAELEKGTPSRAVLKNVRDRLAAFGQQLPRKVGDSFTKFTHQPNLPPPVPDAESPLARAKRQTKLAQALLTKVMALGKSGRQ